MIILLRATGVDEQRDTLEMLGYLHLGSAFILLHMISRRDLIVAHRLSIQKRHAASLLQALLSPQSLFVLFLILQYRTSLRGHNAPTDDAIKETAWPCEHDPMSDGNTTVSVRAEMVTHLPKDRYQ
jgi:hypothetical protein